MLSGTMPEGLWQTHPLSLPCLIQGLLGSSVPNAMASAPSWAGGYRGLGMV